MCEKNTELYPGTFWTSVIERRNVFPDDAFGKTYEKKRLGYNNIRHAEYMRRDE